MIHPTAIVETADIGAGTRIWAYTHILAGAKIGANCNIGDHVFIEGGVVVGDGVTVKNGVALWEGVVLEDGVFIGPNAVFANDRYPRSPRGSAAGTRYDNKEWLEETVVETGASIGANATVLCGVRIGKYALVGAGAVVTGDVPPHALVIGSPARHAGWVCTCGQPLTEMGSLLNCASCLRRYDRAELENFKTQHSLTLRTNEDK